MEQATRRSGVVWLLADGTGPPQPVWHLWHAGAAHVVHGGAEQVLDGVGDGDRVLVVVRSKHSQSDRVVQWWAVAHALRPGTPAWDEIVPLLHARRLNARDGDGEPARWARESSVLTLTPDGTERAVERAGSLRA